MNAHYYGVCLKWGILPKILTFMPFYLEASHLLYIRWVYGETFNLILSLETSILDLYILIFIKFAEFIIQHVEN